MDATRRVALATTALTVALAGGGLAARAAGAAPEPPPSPPAAGVQTVSLGSLVPGGSSTANDINDRGQVVGYADTATGDQHAVLWQDGRIRDLGTLGGQFSYAAKINEKGWVIGTSETADHRVHGFIWRNGRMTDLGTLDGVSAIPVDINDRGQIAGTADGQEIGDYRSHGFVWQDGRLTSVHRGTYVSSRVVGIAESGDVLVVGGNVPFVWNRGSGVYLYGPSRGVQRPLRFDASAIAENGLVAGAYLTPAGEWRGALVRDGRPVADVGPAGTYASPQTVNRRGDVVGYESTPGSGGIRSYFWRDGTYTPIAFARGYLQPTALTESGQVLGRALEDSGQAVTQVAVWKAGRVTLVTPPGDYSAADLNARGEAVGTTGTYPNRSVATLWRIPSNAPSIPQSQVVAPSQAATPAVTSTAASSAARPALAALRAAATTTTGGPGPTTTPTACVTFGPSTPAAGSASPGGTAPSSPTAPSSATPTSAPPSSGPPPTTGPNPTCVPPPPPPTCTADTWPLRFSPSGFTGAGRVTAGPAAINAWRVSVGIAYPDGRLLSATGARVTGPQELTGRARLATGATAGFTFTAQGLADTSFASSCTRL